MRAWGLAWGLAGAIVLAYSAALACKAVPYTGVRSGFLGRSYLEPQPTLLVPRNVAVADMGLGAPVELLDESGAAIELEPVPGTVWSRPVTPLEPGAVVSAYPSAATVGDVLDETAPSAPELRTARVSVVDSGRGCLRVASTCDGLATLHLTIVPAADDYSPPERMTYAMYGGATSDEAANVELPHRLLVAIGGESALEESWNFGDVDDVEWVAIAAVDQAGNESARTAPVARSGLLGGCPWYLGRLSSTAHTAPLTRRTGTGRRASMEAR